MKNFKCGLFILIMGCLLGTSVYAAYNNPRYVQATKILEQMAHEEMQNPGKYSMLEIKERRLPYLQIVQQTYMLDEHDKVNGAPISNFAKPNKDATHAQHGEVIVLKKGQKLESLNASPQNKKGANVSAGGASFQNVVKKARPGNSEFKVRKSMFSQLLSKSKKEPLKSSKN